MPGDLLESTARSLHYRLACAQRDGRAPSIVAGVVRDGRLVWSAGVGAVAGEPHRVAYRIASITKTFTAVLILQLRDEGKLDLTDPLRTYLPEIDSPSTVAQVLTHLSGLTSELPGEWFERVSGSGYCRPDLGAAGWPVTVGGGSAAALLECRVRPAR